MNGLSIDPDGMWSLRQASAVVEALEDQLKARGLKAMVLDITNHSMPVGRFLISVRCAKHECVVDKEARCPVCDQRNIPRQP